MPARSCTTDSALRAICHISEINNCGLCINRLILKQVYIHCFHWFGQQVILWSDNRSKKTIVFLFTSHPVADWYCLWPRLCVSAACLCWLSSCECSLSSGLSWKLYLNLRQTTRLSKLNVTENMSPSFSRRSRNALLGRRTSTTTCWTCCFPDLTLDNWKKTYG